MSPELWGFIEFTKRSLSLHLVVREPGNSVEGIYPLLDEFKSSLEEIDPVLRNMDANMLEKMNKDKDRSDQKVQELEG